MATQEEIIKLAGDLGELIAQSEQAKQLTDAGERLKSDVTARQAVQNFNQLLQSLSMKEQTGQPIEVSEKKQLEQMQQNISTNITIQAFQQAQMNYVQLMRDVDKALTEAGPNPMANPAQEPQQPSTQPPAGPESKILY